MDPQTVTGRSIPRQWPWMACLCLLTLACACTPSIQNHASNHVAAGRENSRCRPAVGPVTDAAALVDALASAPPEAVQTDAQASGCFLPLARLVEPHEGSSNVLSSAPLRQLVAMGAVAIPAILLGLDDDRPTRFGVSPLASNPHIAFHYLEHTEEVDPYDREAVALLTNKAKALSSDNDAREHKLTVGDLCFFALGQIVNRYYLPIQFPSKFTAIVTSPIKFPAMVERLRHQWGTLDTAQHAAQLSSELEQAGTPRFREDTWLRLQYYFPDAAGLAASAAFTKERENPDRWHSLAVLIDATLPVTATAIAGQVQATVAGLLTLPVGHEFLGLSCVDFLVASRSGLDLAEKYAVSAAQGRTDSPFNSRIQQIKAARR